MMKLVEENSGVGQLIRNGETLREVRYQIRRYQGMMEGSGLPIPGLFRIEGSIDLDPSDSRHWINVPLILKLADGRSLGINLVNANGRVLSEGHGPMKCMCC
jgi:hypothetical protein